MTETSSNRLFHTPKIVPSSSSKPSNFPSNHQHQEQEQQQQQHEIPKLQPQQYPTHLDAAEEVLPATRIICEILTRSSPNGIEAALTATGIVVTQDIVNQVLKLSYNSPSSAIKFFRWAGASLKHSDYVWNLMVDLLGKNQLFEPMWDAVRSMKQEGLLSTVTFVSIFGSYCTAHRFNEAVMSFDVMDRYDIQPDVVAVNSLLSAICRQEDQKQTSKAMEFFDKIKGTIAPDGDTFAILLEGWEKEGNVSKAKSTFGEMVVRIGWSPSNMPAYDAFLITLVRGSHADEAIKFLRVMTGYNCLPGLKFFSNALDILIKQNDSAPIVLLWDIMVGSGLVPNLIMYNAVIGLLCNNNNIHNVLRFLDDMVFHGAFPDSFTYNMIFQCLIKNKKVRLVGIFFSEMVKNEWPPTHTNCAAAITMLLEKDDPEMAIEIWNYMVDHGISPHELSGNALLIGLQNMGRLSEVKTFADDMLDREIKIYESTMENLKNAFHKEGRSKRDKFDSLMRRWKAS